MNTALLHHVSAVPFLEFLFHEQNPDSAVRRQPTFPFI
jgi:hypothetical protein